MFMRLSASGALVPAGYLITAMSKRWTQSAPGHHCPGRCSDRQPLGPASGSDRLSGVIRPQDGRASYMREETFFTVDTDKTSSGFNKLVPSLQLGTQAGHRHWAYPAEAVHLDGAALAPMSAAGTGWQGPARGARY